MKLERWKSAFITIGISFVLFALEIHVEAGKASDSAACATFDRTLVRWPRMATGVAVVPDGIDNIAPGAFVFAAEGGTHSAGRDEHRSRGLSRVHETGTSGLPRNPVVCRRPRVRRMPQIGGTVVSEGTSTNWRRCFRRGVSSAANPFQRGRARRWNAGARAGGLGGGTGCRSSWGFVWMGGL